MAKINKEFFKYQFSRNQDWLINRILKPGEEVLHVITNCRIKDVYPGKSERTPVGIFMATNQRVVIIIPRFLKEFEVEEYPYDQITSVGPCETRYFSGCVDIVAGRIKRTIYWINPAKEAKLMIEIISERMKMAKET
ncbi:MAG: PH domain-containing protein [Methanomassiliicoccales archaeon]|nr:PH domain-containing protein [Methanomassiliicoccales archaeon]